jgi:hypothetical protein
LPPVHELKEVYALQGHPASDRVPVEVTHVAPAAGYYVATFDNALAWRERRLYHRWDIIDDEGRIVEGAALQRVVELDDGRAVALPRGTPSEEA